MLVAFVTLGVGSVALLPTLQADSDMLAALPADAPEVQTFREIATRFGGLDVAQVGIVSDAVFSHDFLQHLKAASQEVMGLPGIKHVSSLTTVQDFVADPEHGGIITDHLVSQVPSDAAGLKALRDRIMAQPQIVGNLISPDGRAVQVVCFLQQHVQQVAVARSIEAVFAKHFPRDHLALGGAPFIGLYVSDVTQSDVTKLAPWSTLALIGILLLALGDARRVAVVLGGTSLGALLWLGLLSVVGARLTPVLSSLPVLLFGIGVAYNLHVLERTAGAPSWSAVLHACRPTLTAAGVTAAALGVLAAVPHTRAFGWMAAVGVLMMMAVAMTFVPAVVGFFSMAAPPSRLGSWIEGLRPVGRRGLLLYGLAVGAALLLMLRLEKRVDMASLLGPKSPPAQANRFMGEHFGGSQFLQMEIDGDFNDPLVLRELQWVADQASLTPGVVSVTHIGDVLAKANEGMEGTSRLPDSRDKAQLLYGFVGSDPAVAQLITRDADHAMILIRVSDAPGAEDEAVRRIEAL
ncbi:MAG TPA: MMPL family transporter, partial [Myxococcota bacterium]|nr:MMPL family transporter [Myxococcota bacterium]